MTFDLDPLLSLVQKEKHKVIMQVVPSDSKNDLIMDLLNTTAAKKVGHVVVALNSGSGDLSKYCNSAGIPIIVLDTSQSIIKQILALFSSIRKFRPNAIYFQSFIPSIWGGILSFLPFRSYKTIAVRHHNRNHHLLKNKRAVLVDRFISMTVDGIVAVSRSVSETLVMEGCKRKKIVIIENGLNYDRYDFAPRILRNISRRDCVEILVVGRLDWQKNFPLLIEIAKGIEASGIDFAINVLGDGNVGERQKWIQRTESLGLGNRITWHGWVRNVSSYFDKSDIFLHTAADEACPLVHIEALFSGIPIISTTNGGCKDVLNTFYTGIASDNPKDFVEAIVQTKEQYSDFQETAMSYISLAKERFNPEISAKSYFE